MNQDELVEIESVKRVDYSSLQISLYFFLLIFFILLNFVKPNKTLNSSNVITSIKKNFGNNEQDMLKYQKQEEIHKIGEFYANKLLDIVPSDFEILTTDDRLTILIKSDVNKFFKDKSTIINKLYQFFLSDLAMVLNQKIKNTNIITQILIGVSDISSKNIELDNNINRIATIADYLVRSGVDSDLIEEKIIDNKHNFLAFSLKLVVR